MSSVVRPPVDPARVGRGGDWLDEVLRDFFRSEMPAPWPAPARATPLPRRTRVSHGRFALAASVGLLLIGSLTMAGALRPGVPDAPVRPLGAEAKKKDLRLPEKLVPKGNAPAVRP